MYVCVCVCVLLDRLRYSETKSEKNREVRDRQTVINTPVESDKRDRGRVGLHNESSSMEVACGKDGEKEGGREG